jgi:hypothetical protein
MPDGANDNTYYRGEVVGVTPEQQAWVDARQAEDADEATGEQEVAP